MRTEVEAKGLTQEEVKEAINSARRNKNMNLLELIEERKRLWEEIIELDETFAELVFGFIRKHHPEIIKTTLI